MKKLIIFLFIVFTLQAISLFSEDYSQIGGFKEGVAIVTLNNKFGFINETGKIVVPIIYDGVNEFKDGLSKVCLKDKKDGNIKLWGFIDKSAKVILPIEYSVIDNFRENGLAKVERGGKIGFIDRNGKIIIPTQYDNIGDFKDGLAIINVGGYINDKLGIYDGKSGFVDETGKIVVSMTYDAVNEFKYGLARVSKKIDNLNKWGFIDKTGKVITPIIFNEITEFDKNGFAILILYNDASLNYFKYGVIDRTGKIVVPVEYGSKDEAYRQLQNK